MRRLLCEQWVQPRVDQGEKAAKDTKGCLCCVACSGLCFCCIYIFFFHLLAVTSRAPALPVPLVTVGRRWSPGSQVSVCGHSGCTTREMLDAAETDPRCESQPWLRMFNDGYF